MAATWDADEPCSVKTALAPESSFTMTPLSTTLPLNFCNFGSTSAFLRWHVSINIAKWTFLFVSLCFQDNFLLTVDFFQSPCWDRLELFPFFIHCCFCIQNVLWHRNTLVRQIVLCHRSKSLACDVVVVHSLSCGIMRFRHTTMKRFWSLLGCNLRSCKHLRDAVWSSLTRHSWYHGSLQFSRIFESFFVFFVINTLFLQHVQICRSRPCHVNVFQWHRECFFLWHVDLNSRFIVMTIDEVTLDRPKVGTGFCVICGFCRLRLSRFTLMFSAEFFAPHGWFPSWSGFSEFVVSPRQFCCTTCNWEMSSSSFCLIRISLALILRE